MYFVNEKPFSDLLDAVVYCKTRPTTTLFDGRGRVLMRHVRVPFELFRDICLAKAVLDIQTSV
jgi:hypothetical protein